MRSSKPKGLEATTINRIGTEPKNKTASDVTCTTSEAGKETAGKPSVHFVFRRMTTRLLQCGAAQLVRCVHQRLAALGPDGHRLPEWILRRRRSLHSAT